MFRRSRVMPKSNAALVRAPCLLCCAQPVGIAAQYPAHHIFALGADQRIIPNEKSRHAVDAALTRFERVLSEPLGKAVRFDREIKFIAVESDLGCKLAQYPWLADIQSLIEIRAVNALLERLASAALFGE